MRQCAWPVHEAARFISALVEEGDADVVRDASCDRAVFLRRYLAGEWDDEPEAWVLRRVAVCGVEAPGSSGQHVRDDLRRVAGAKVDVQCHE